MIYAGLMLAAIGTVQIEILNLDKEIAKDRWDSNRAALAVEQFERDLFAKMDGPDRRRPLDDGLGKLPANNFRGAVSFPTPPPK